LIIGVVAVPESLTSTIASLEAAGEARRAARDSRLMRARFEILRVDILVTVLGFTKLSKGFSIPLGKGTLQGTIASQKVIRRHVGGGSPPAPLFV
jgi:hypothetical protein